MSAWTRFDDVRARLDKAWQRGELLRAWRWPGERFPWRLPLKKPGPRELADDFEAARAWVRHWQAVEERKGLSLEWKQVNHRQLGRNALPAAVVLESPEQALRQTGHLQDAKRFDALCDEIVHAFTELEDWLQKRPLAVLERSEDWPRLLAVLRWLRDHPRPGIYLRQLDLPGVHTKFIERHRGLLGELLDRVLPPDAIDSEVTGATAFERRYGFRTKPAQLRLRLLDPTHRIAGLDDLQIPVADFNRLAPAVETVYIVENEITALAFPPRPASMILFGQGYSAGPLLAEAHWLAEKRLLYWGDIDTHGFAILDRLRRHWPQTRSLLMDRATLMNHRHLWGREEKPIERSLPRLTPPEKALYEDLCGNRLGEKLRLEQEQLPLSLLTGFFP